MNNYEACVKNLEKAIKHSFGLEENENIDPDTKFKYLDKSVSRADLLEIFSSIEVDSNKFKPYFTEDKLTEKGRLFLKKIGDYLERKIASPKGYVHNVYALACAESLDELAQNATMRDFLHLREYLDVTQPNTL